MGLKIALLIPSPAGQRDGNWVTARRWAGHLKDLGHATVVVRRYRARDCDVLVALHAVKSWPGVRIFRQRHRKRPLVVTLTGTDLYPSLPGSGPARRSLEWADRIIVLQKAALQELDSRLRPKTRVIYQSAGPPKRAVKRVDNRFLVAVVGHLREVKDPLRTASSARLLPRASKVAVEQAGAILEPRYAALVKREERLNPRYAYLGPKTPAAALRLIARARLLVISSRAEGSSNVLSEALACGTPVLATATPGLLGTLGEDYPGLFEPGDTRGLAKLLHRAETEVAFLEKLQLAARRLRPLVDPARERLAWKMLIEELR